MSMTFGKSPLKIKEDALNVAQETMFGYYPHPSDSDYTVKVSTTDHTEILGTSQTKQVPTDSGTVIISIDNTINGWMVRTKYSSHAFNDFMEMAAFIAEYYGWEEDSDKG